MLTVCTVEETPIQYERLYELAYHVGCKLNGIEPLGYHPGKDGPKP